MASEVDDDDSIFFTAARTFVFPTPAFFAVCDSFAAARVRGRFSRFTAEEVVTRVVVVVVILEEMPPVVGPSLVVEALVLVPLDLATSAEEARLVDLDTVVRVRVDLRTGIFEVIANS